MLGDDCRLATAKPKKEEEGHSGDDHPDGYPKRKDHGDEPASQDQGKGRNCDSGQAAGNGTAIWAAVILGHGLSPNGRAFSGEPSERSERPERTRGRRVRCNAMLDANRTREVGHGCHLSTWKLDHAPRRAASATAELKASRSLTLTLG